MSARVIKIGRRMTYASDAVDETTHGSGVQAETNDILARVDLEDDGRRLVDVVLDEATYAGIIAEWDAGVATTIVEASLVTAIAAIVVGTDLPVDELTATQRANLVQKAVAWP